MLILLILIWFCETDYCNPDCLVIVLKIIFSNSRIRTNALRIHACEYCIHYQIPATVFKERKFEIKIKKIFVSKKIFSFFLKNKSYSCLVPMSNRFPMALMTEKLPRSSFNYDSK